MPPSEVEGRSVYAVRGSTHGFYFNLDGDCIFSPLAVVEPYSLIQLASLKRTGVQETKEEGGKGQSL